MREYCGYKVDDAERVVGIVSPPPMHQKASAIVIKASGEPGTNGTKKGWCKPRPLYFSDKS